MSSLSIYEGMSSLLLLLLLWIGVMANDLDPCCQVDHGGGNDDF